MSGCRPFFFLWGQELVDELKDLGVLYTVERLGWLMLEDFVDDLRVGDAFGVGFLLCDHFEHAHTKRIDIHGRIVMFLIEFWCHIIWRAQH